MHIDLTMSLAGLIVGVIVGLTGMGGGALMTPVLVLFFHTAPSSAVSSDLVTSLFMRPLGGAVHWRRGTVHRSLVFWLLISAVPSAFAGVFVLKALNTSNQLQDRIKLGLGAALFLAFASMVLRMLTASRAATAAEGDGLDTPVRKLPTVMIGLLGGLVVGMTSVGSGSMMIVALMWLYPRLSNRALVGTDLVQAIPLVGSAALAHLLFGDVSFGVTASLLIGSLPGVFVGAQISSRTTAPWLRPVLAAVLLASALKLVNAPSVPTGAAALGVGIALVGLYLRRARQDRAAQPDVVDGARETSARAHLSQV
jgi:uncharacterized membrane protein YfcA